MSYPGYPSYPGGAPPPTQYDPAYAAQYQNYYGQQSVAPQAYGGYPQQPYAAPAPAPGWGDPSQYSQQYPAAGQQPYPYYPQAPAAPANPWAGYIAPNAFRNKKALLIGINYIGHARGQLRGCINDVKNIYNFLTTKYSYRPENIIVLTDDQTDPSRRPTRVNIINGCKWLLNGNQPGDAFFFHFSGHGGQVEDKSGDEDDGYDETILPCDYNTAGQIIDDDLHTLLVKPLVEGARLTAVMDCCHSGTGMDLPFVHKAKGPKMPKDPKLKEQKKLMKQYKKQGYKVKVEKDKSSKAPKVNKKMAKRAAEISKTLISRGTVVGLSGCADHQTSADTSYQGQAQGAMSAALIHVLTANNFTLTYDSLLYKMREHLAEQAKAGKGITQIPQLSYGREPFNLQEYFTM